MSETKPKARRPFMPGYGILDEKSGKGLLPWKWARERLTAVPYYWVASTRPDGRPHSMPVWGIWVEDVFYFSTGRDSRKARNLRVRPDCVVSVGSGDDAVVVEGTAREIRDASLLAELSKVYQAKYGMGLDPELGPIYAVEPAVAFGFVGASHEGEGSDEFVGTATRWEFP